MTEKAILIDTTKCMGCRGCQTACKQWWELDYYPTTFSGSFQNPPDFTPYNWTIVRFIEYGNNGDFKWLFMKDQCRHCNEPPCRVGCPVEGVIVKDESGGVYYNVELCGKCNLQCKSYCPFGVPRNRVLENGQEERRAFKCRFCIDRVKNGEVPLCVKTCVTGALNFGDKEAILNIVYERIEKLKSTYPDINIYPGTNFNVMWILPYRPEIYGLKSLTDEDIKKRTAELKIKEIQPVQHKYASILPDAGLAWLIGTIGWIINRRMSNHRKERKNA